ncbi:MAG: oligosaccharide flippase family protein, partial [Humidesulfovibrio sp.]|nr:oligosaccharide flippase family protein [Humidesulfovibrio sp.]
SVIEGYQRVHVIQFAYMVWMFYNLVATFMGLMLAPSIFTLGIVYVGGNVLLFLIFCIYASKHFQCVCFSTFRVKIAVYKEIVPYSTWIQVSSLIILLKEPIIKFVLTRTQGLADLAQFEIAYRVTLQAMSFAIIPVLTAFSVAAKLHDNHDELRIKVHLYNGMVFAILIPAVICVILFSEEFVRLWLGEKQLLVAWFLKYIFCAYSIYYLAEPMYKVLSGIGKAYLSAALQTIYIVSFVVCCYFIKNNTILYSLLISSFVYFLATLITFKRALW